MKNEINKKGKTQQNRSRFFTCGGCDIFYMRQLHDIEWLINPPPSPITGDFCRKIFTMSSLATQFLLLNLIAACIVKVSLQLLLQMNNKGRTLNKMLCENKN